MRWLRELARMWISECCALLSKNIEFFGSASANIAPRILRTFAEQNIKLGERQKRFPKFPSFYVLACADFPLPPGSFNGLGLRGEYYAGEINLR